MLDRPRQPRRYIEPAWPEEPFFLLALEGDWTLGPFEPAPETWGTGPEGEKFWADGATHPVVLRIRGQDGDIVHANDGEVSDMDYRVVPLSEAPPEWL